MPVFPARAHGPAAHAGSPELTTSVGDSAWEDAYERFETPAQEIAKFTRRLKSFGAQTWPRDARIVELFCGRGNGLVTLERLGFTSLAGVDLSPALVAAYRGAAQCHVADCRHLPFADASQDILIVQGGLHHLLCLPDDLDAVLAEARRVLVPGGKLVVVEPWRTPFLDFVHRVCAWPVARRLWPRLDAMYTMIIHELATYDQWLDRPAEILRQFETHFEIERRDIGWGKLRLLGVRRS